MSLLAVRLHPQGLFVLLAGFALVLQRFLVLPVRRQPFALLEKKIAEVHPADQDCWDAVDLLEGDSRRLAMTHGDQYAA